MNVQVSPFHNIPTDLTPRQRQVLRLIASGRTNAEIATALDISLDGAKWHVSEIISKMGVSSRDEAADVWRAENGLRRRIFRAISSALLTKSIWYAGGAAAVLGAAAIVAVIIRDTVSTSEGAATPASATSSASGPAAAPREVINGVQVAPLSIGSPTAVPPGVQVYYNVHGFGTDSGPATLMRATHPASSALQREGVYANLPGGTLYTAATDLRHGVLVAAVCTQGDCGLFSPATPDAKNIAYRSVDGGATWTALGSLPPDAFLVGVMGDQAIVGTRVAGHDPAYVSFPGGATFSPPTTASEAISTADGSMFWRDRDTREYRSFPGGAPVWATPANARSLGLVVGTTTDGYIVSWETDSLTYVGTIDPHGTLLKAASFPRTFSLSVAGAISPSLLVGNVGLDGNGAPVEGVPNYFQPAIIDLDTGQAQPLLEISAGLAGSNNGQNRHAFVEAVVQD